jgi:hypothetical protein
MTASRLLSILWPAFLAACLLEGLVFAFVDPAELEWAGRPLGWGRQVVYTGAFFGFWAVSMAACWMTALLRLSAEEVNRCPFDPGQRPDGCPGK